MSIVSSARQFNIPEEVINPPDQVKDTRIVMAKMVGYQRTSYLAKINCKNCKHSAPMLELLKCTQHQFIPVTTDNNVCDFHEF